MASIFWDRRIILEQEKKIIGVCVAGLDRDHPGRFVNALCNKAKQQNRPVVVYNVFKKLDYMNSFLEGEIQVFQHIPWERLCVLLIFTESIDNEEVSGKLAECAHEHGIPVISVDRCLEGCHNVLFAYEEAFERIVRHIVEHHGCRTINFMAGFQNNDFSDARINIFKKVLAENHIPFDEKRMAYGQFWEMPARLACEKWVTKWQVGMQEMPEAIICANDIMALTVCNVLMNHGIRVPEDVLLTGFDGLGLVSYCTPNLTTARDDMSLIGKELMKMVDRCIEDPEMEPVEIMISFQTVFSESCGCNPIQVHNTNEQIMELYGKAAQMRLQSNDLFFMMSTLTDGYSAFNLAKNLHSYQHFIGVRSLLLFMNPTYYQETDIPHKGFDSDSMLLMSEIRHGEYHAPLTEISREREQEMIEEMLEKKGQLLMVPIHQQEEQYGCMVTSFADCAEDVGAFYEFVLALNQMLGTIKKQSQLHRMFITDNLTELYNRRGFYGELKKAVNRLEGREMTLFIASVDMDGLKYINDSFGHAEGDYAIKTVADFLRGTMEGRKGVCARFGGDEFMVAILSDAQEEDVAFYESYEGILQKRVERFERRSKKPYQIGVSIGCIHRRIKSLEDVDGLMKKADDIMYDCKATHKNSRTARIRENRRL